MHRLHSGFTVADEITVATEIMPDPSGSLKRVLQKLSKKGSNFLHQLKDCQSTLFISGVILPQEDYYLTGTQKKPETLPKTFVFATTYCGPFSNHLEEMIQTNKNVLCEIFKHCKNFPPEDLRTNERVAAYLRSHSHNSAFNSRYNCITKQDAKREKQLRKEIENYIDKAQGLHAFDNRSALEVKTLIQRHIATRGDKYEWCHKPERKNIIELYFINRGKIIPVLLLLMLLIFLSCRPRYIFHFIAISLVAILLTIFLVSEIRKYISREESEPAKRVADRKLRSIATSQQRPVLNEMTAAAALKKGRLRRFFYAFALKVINILAPFLMKVPTVSNLRWLVVNDRKRLLFLSNFSNTTDFYVRDFLNGNTPIGVNFMFTNGQGFPDAKMLTREGITSDPEGYMDAVHTGQKITDLWYAHEPHLTADIINKNRKIRNGLFKKMNEDEANQWLKLL